MSEIAILRQLSAPSSGRCCESEFGRTSMNRVIRVFDVAIFIATGLRGAELQKV